MIRTIVHYTGNVQGVGFRWTANNLAKDYKVAGYVQNLPDGRVLLEAQGERDEVEGFLHAMDKAMQRNIKSKVTEPHPPDPAFKSPDSPRSFDIKH